MAKISIPLASSKDKTPFTREQLEILFTWPNIPVAPGEQPQSLEDTIAHWFGQTLERDGLAADMLSVSCDNGAWVLHLDGPSDAENQRYAVRLPGLLEIGWGAHLRTETEVKPSGNWDPSNKGNWRFFLTLGVGVANFRSLQLFHYPPARLVNPLQDSMHDPVTFRCRDLLEANGVTYDRNDNAKNQTRLYETRINSTPIAAPDDQGTPQKPYFNGVAPDRVTGSYIPIEYYTQFQQQMIQLYLHKHPTVEGYTIPMIVYGRTPRMQLAGQWMGPDCAALLQMLPKDPDSHNEFTLTNVSVDTQHFLLTPVLGSNHPYLFFAKAQIDRDKGLGVGCAQLVPNDIDGCVSVMQDDLAVVYWQTRMAEDPSQNPWHMINEAKSHWREPAQLLDVCALIWRQASLYYAPDDPDGNHFSFGIDDWKIAKKTIEQSGLDPVAFLKQNAGTDLAPK